MSSIKCSVVKRTFSLDQRLKGIGFTSSGMFLRYNLGQFVGKGYRRMIGAALW